ncbi:MAG: hypothetical protein IJ366_10130 [Clostridia bacterium]|nr:hypothetical protein [Clostridia bacterium]
MITGICKRILCLATVLAAGFTAASAEPISYGFVEKFVQQGESGFVCEYEQYSESIHKVSAWNAGAALKLSNGTVLPDGDADGMISYTWDINAVEAGIYRIILNATPPAKDNYYSDWVLYINGEQADINKGTTEENNQTFANWTTAQLKEGSNILTLSVAPRKSGGNFWFILDRIRFLKYEPTDAAAGEIGNAVSVNGTISAKVKNTFTEDFYADIYLSVSTGEQLKSVEKQTVLLSVGETKTVNFENSSAVDGDILKTYLWNSGTMIPCSVNGTAVAVNAEEAELNVFEYGSGVLLNLSSESDISYTVYDYFDNQVSTGTAEAFDGEANIILPKELDTGWYRVYEGDTQLSAFAVVPKYEDRADVSSPFATDFAAAWLVKDSSGNRDYDKIGQYSRVIKLAGIDWVRERASTESLNPSEGTYDFSGLHSTTEIMADSGLEVSAVFHSTPTWAKESGSSLYTDLGDIYSFMKNASSEMSGEVDSWEIWNEQDEQLYSTESADRYAAFFKAAAIGAADGGNAKKLLGGIAQSPLVRNYTSLMLQNDVMEYADAYNYHTYTKDSGAETAYLSDNAMQAHFVQKTSYDNSDAPIWITETGVHCAVEEGSSDIALAQKKLQARCSVTNAVTTLANAADKAFWFVMPSYNENSKNFGAFTSDHLPNPAYSAMAVMTEVLGEAEYVGELNIENAHGYVFADGADNAAVIWADEAMTVTLPVTAGYTVDIMGGRTELKASDGAVSIEIGPDPIYLVSNNITAMDCYYPQSFEISESIKTDFSDAQRIVISALPEEVNNTEAKFRGYRINKIDSIPLEVYNFTDKTMTGSLRANAEFEGIVSFSEEEFSISPMGKTVINANISAENVVAEESYGLRIYGVFSGEETTSSVMRVIFPYPDEKIDEVVLYKSNSTTDTTVPDGWNVNNISGGTATVDIADSAVTFSVNFTASSSNWFYPVFKTPPAHNTNVGKSKGFTFTVTADKTYEDVYLNAMLYYDGAASLFYLGSRPYVIEEGTHTYFVPWEAFVYNTGTVGTERTVTPSKVTSVSVGLNTYAAGDIEYTVGNVGYYFEENEKTEYTVKITDDNGYAVESELNNIKLLVNGKEMTADEINGLSKGKYIITAAGFTEWNEAVTDTKVIYVN